MSTNIDNITELDSNKGIGLVDRIRRGLGKPDIIYVKNFMVQDEEEPLDADVSTEVGKTDFRRSEMSTSRSQEIGLQEVGISAPNYNNSNNNNMSYINHINQSGGMGDNSSEQRRIDVIEDTSVYMAIIRENLEYDHHMKYDHSKNRELFEEIYETIYDIVCVKRNGPMSRFSTS